MTASHPPPAPVVRRTHQPGGGATGDHRVAAVLEVLGGTPVLDVARRCGVEPALVHRWVRLFTEAGTAGLIGRPEPVHGHQRDRFLAAFAHELRTPLTVAQGWASMLADGDLPVEMTADTAATLSAALTTVGERVREAECLAAAALGKLRVTPRPVPAAALAPNALTTPVLGEPDLLVATDPELAARVVRDLWHAAGLQPTPVRREVEVRRVGASVEVRVVRHGEPIETRVLQALLSPFEHNDDDTGVTVGLHLARALAVALDGAIGLDGDDGCAVFWLRLPLADHY